ncbi:MAG: PEP-CTERM sorting domain-containing protein, partial [Planctomycetaceae bacterium]|nr:PEP-CTERM sorting domain-containing protein [Planctomycetaceae bacterium]
DFSGFTGTVLLKAAPDSANRVMLSGRTVNFGENATLRIDDQGQLYLSNSSVYGNLEFGSSDGYQSDTGYQAALRSDGASNSYVYGTVKLLDDGAAISTRANNNGNVENGSKLTLYADVTGSGSLTKHEDSEGYAGVLSFGTIEKDGKTYGGTVAYEGTTAVKSGVLRVLDGVTMHVQDDVTLGTDTMKGTFDLEKGAVLSIGAPDAETGSVIEFSGNGTVYLGGALELDIFAADDFDQIIIESGLLSESDVPESVDIWVAEGVEITDEPIQLTQGFTSDIWKGVDINVSDGWVSMIMANGNLAVGLSSDGSVPEPSSLLLLLSGFTLLGVRRIFRKKC